MPLLQSLTQLAKNWWSGVKQNISNLSASVSSPFTSKPQPTPTPTPTSTPTSTIPKYVGEFTPISSGGSAGGFTSVPNVQDDAAKRAELQRQINQAQAQVAALSRQISSLTTPTTQEKGIIPQDQFSLQPVFRDLSPLSQSFTEATQDTLFGTAGLTSLLPTLQRYKEMQVGLEDTFNKLKQLQENQPSKAELLQKAREQYKVPEYFDKLNAIIPEIADLRTKLVDLETKEEKSLLAIEQQPIPMPIIIGEQEALRKQFAIEKQSIASMLSAKAAIAEMYRGNLELGERFAQNYVQLATYDYQQKLDTLKWFTNYYQEELKDMKGDIRFVLDKQIDLVKKQLDLKREEEKTKINYITEAAKAGIDLSYLLSGKVEDVAREYAKKVSVKKVETGVINSDAWVQLIRSGQATISNIPDDATRNIVASKLVAEQIRSFEDILKQAIQEGANTSQAVEAVKLLAQKQGIQLTSQQIQELTQKAQEFKSSLPQTVVSPTQPTLSPTSFQFGKNVRENISRIKEAIKEPLIEYVGKPALVVEDFFKGLFAR